MDQSLLKEILENVKSGQISTSDAVEALKTLPFEDLGFANIDEHRNIRTGHPETIYCQGKTEQQIVDIVKKMVKNNSNFMGTRASEEVFQKIKEFVPEAVYHKEARMFVVKKTDMPTSDKIIAVVTAGTSDIPVAEEAAVTAETMGNKVERIYDVGVAGIHRLFARIDRIREANVVIVVAGMEGALASVMGGLLDKPIIAVPTSVGYGANFGGIAALLTMLNSCATGVAVVNIDNGFGAGAMASKINKL